MILIKKKPSTSGQRHQKVLIKFIPKNNLKKWQSITKTPSIGRSSKYGILAYSKKQKALKKSINVLEEKQIIKHKFMLCKYIYSLSNKTYAGLIKYSNGAYSNIILTHGFLPGNFAKCTNYKSSKFNKFDLGYSVLLFFINKKTVFHNIYICFRKKTIFSKSAGTFSTILSIDNNKFFFKIKLPSGEKKILNQETFVTLGRNSNVLSKAVVLGKYSSSSNLGFKPTVRGVAMNPVDHPHGGRSKTNSPEKTPWGKVTKNNK